MKKLSAAVIAAAVAISASACGQAEAPQATSTITVEQPTSTTEPPLDESTPGKTGERVKTSQKAGNEVYETIESISLSPTCKYPTGFSDDTADEGWQFLSIEAILEVDKLQNPDNVGQPVSMSGPVAIDKDGFTQYLEPTIKCGYPDDGRQIWYSMIHEGEKIRVFGSFDAPIGVQKIKVAGRTFDVASDE